MKPNCLLLGHAKPSERKRKQSDSTPNEDETLPIKMKRLENEVQLLKERVESQEKQINGLPFQFLETRLTMAIIPAEEGN